MSYVETVLTRLETKRARLRSIEAIKIQPFGGVAEPKMVENELRRQIAVDEKILRDLA